MPRKPCHHDSLKQNACNLACSHWSLLKKCRHYHCGLAVATAICAMDNAQREEEREIDRQVEGQVDRFSWIQIDSDRFRQVQLDSDRFGQIQIDSDRFRQIGRQIDRQIYKQLDRQIDRQIDHTLNYYEVLLGLSKQTPKTQV